jgi:ubiquitin carboxyl-terminal hydrolase 4/11/15
VRAVGQRQEASLELRPPQFSPLLLVNTPDLTITGPPAPTVTVSADTSVGEFCQQLARALKSSHDPSDTRIWALVHPRTEVDGSQYPISRLLEVGGRLLSEYDEQRKTLDDALIQSGDLFAVEFREQAAWLVDAATVPAPGDAPGIEKELPPPLFNSENDFFSRMQTGASGKPSLSSVTSKDITIRPTSSKLPGFYKSTVSNKVTSTSNTKIKDPGTLGLGNMYASLYANERYKLNF